MSKVIDLTDKRFGKLNVLSRSFEKTTEPRAYWKCLCDCGNYLITTTNCLTTGNTKSCGKCNDSQNIFYEKEDYMVCLSSQGDEILFDKEDYNKIKTKTWGTKGRYAIARHCNSTTTIPMHRIIMDAPEGFHVDHINGKRLDNRKSNLRLCTNQENQFNKHISFGESKFKGVSRTSKAYRRPWRATIKKNGKTISLGSFNTEEDAARAYDKKANELFGEFAKLNFTDI